MSDLRGDVGGATKGWERTYFPLKGMLAFWDVSLGHSNNRGTKLGSKDSVTGVAIYQRDNTTSKSKLATGVTRRTNSRHSLEPDNWVLRLHTPDGHGYDNTWDVRLIAEHENKASGRKHRSTIWINQCPDQCWAWSQDFVWVKKLTAPVFDAELSFDGGGFLRSVYSDDVATEDARGCAMLNISKRGFYVTDGGCASQGWHIFSMRCRHVKAPPPEPTGGDHAPVATPDASGRLPNPPFDLFGQPIPVPPGGGGGGGGGGAGTVDTVVEEPVTTVETPKGCCDVKRTQLALRGDVNFHMTDDMVHIAMGPGYPTYGCIATGWHWKGAPSPEPPAEELADDPSSNQEILPRSLEKGLRPLVLVPEQMQSTDVATGPFYQYGGLPYPAGHGDPIPTFLSSGGGGGGSGGGAAGIFKNGVLTGEPILVQLPHAAGVQDLYVALEYYLSDLLAMGTQMDFELHYKVFQPGRPAPGGWTLLSKSITDDDNPSSVTDLSQLVFRIQNVHAGLARGGYLYAWFYRKGATDTSAKDWIQVGNAIGRGRTPGEALRGTEAQAG